jgi:uncharacterized protein with HEPN domain
MLPSNVELLKHILDEINFVLKETSTLSFVNFVDDPVLKRAVVRSLEIIGEASKKIHPDFKSANPEIDWRGMAGTRDKLIHDYFGVDYELVWDIIQNNLPELKIMIEDAIKES